MIGIDLKKAFINGEIAQLIPIEKLKIIKKELDRFKQLEELNNFQNWIVNDLYKFEVADIGFPAKSIILIAIPHPFYAKVEFTYNGRKIKALSLVMSDFETTESHLKNYLFSQNYKIAEAPDLPLKRLAVQSGLAVYGRNNICYINSMGSNFSFIAYYSDIPCDNKKWREITMARTCTYCKACLNNCPTGAIQKNRFLINNEKCLSYLNENKDPFPEWLPKSAHHCIYDCLKCQIICPMNKAQVKKVTGPVIFSESETRSLLSGIIFNKITGSFKQKVKYLGLHQWPDGIAKNIKVLIELCT